MATPHVAECAVFFYTILVCEIPTKFYGQIFPMEDGMKIAVFKERRKSFFISLSLNSIPFCFF